ncbi:MAG: ABC transporter substrate-binding protein, partial [Nitrososphaerales archaeon]
MTLVAGCGARVGPYLGASETNPAAGGKGAALSANNGSSSNANGGVIGGDAGTGGTPGSSGSSGSSARSSGASAAVNVPPPAQFSFDPKSEAAACPNSTGNTSSAPGVTPSSVTLGNVSGLTGPLAGTIPQAVQATEAAISAINAAGGICGRKLDLDVEDDQQDSST